MRARCMHVVLVVCCALASFPPSTHPDHAISQDAARGEYWKVSEGAKRQRKAVETLVVDDPR